MTEHAKWVEVVVPLPFRKPLTYALPDQLAAPVGVRVLVPLGPRRLTAYVVGHPESPPDGVKIRPVLDILDQQPIFGPELLALCQWASRYYHESLGEMLSTALPGGINQQDARMVCAGKIPSPEVLDEDPLLASALRVLEGGEQRLQTFLKTLKCGVRPILRWERDGWVGLNYALKKGSARVKTSLTAVFVAEVETSRRAPKDRRILEHLNEVGFSAVADLRKQFGQVRGNLLRLEELGGIRMEERRVLRDPSGMLFSVGSESDVPPPLTPEQVPAVAALEKGVRDGQGRFLLHGVTGSGKTEVYLRAIETALDMGKGSIVLVPEIALTPQLAGRFQRRFGSSIALLHSGLKPGEKLDQWTEIAEGRRRVVVGARSAIFAPVSNLGLIVVDEEHEASFKQENKPRYHARDLAMVRGAREGAAVVVGSATPSMETLANGEKGRFQVLRMENRVLERPLPSVELVDLRTERPKGKHRTISPRLAEALKQTVERGQQAVLFINRRGFSSCLVCMDCGYVEECPSCSISLSYTQRYEQMRCHYCGYRQPPPDSCGQCKGTSFEASGAGTERIEGELRAILGSAVSIGRLDRDTASGKGLIQVLDAFRERKTQVLIGTQMVAKGHDFPGVTLVGVLHADQGLRFPEFRAAERTHQLITQVAGRAGRGTEPGRVLIQTYSPEHYVMQAILKEDPEGFVRREMTERKEFGYPPFTHLAVVLISHEDGEVALQKAQRVQEFLQGVVEHLKAERSLYLFGPVFAPIQRLKNKTRLQILLKSSERSLLHRVLDHFDGFVSEQNEWGSISLDVDPINLL